MTTITTIGDPPIRAVDRLQDDLRELSTRWQPHASELQGLLERWGPAWNAHDLDALEALVTEDITWEDPAMHGETVHGRAEFRASPRSSSTPSLTCVKAG